MYWLGIDIGTGGSRALLVDEHGAVHASRHRARTKICRWLRPLWAEQRPENWWDAAQEAIRGVLARTQASRGATIQGIGLSGQMHGLTLLDEADNVIRPALIWCDQRSQAQVDWINATSDATKCSSTRPIPWSPASLCRSCSGSATMNPKHFERVRKVLLPERLRALPPHGRVRQRSFGRIRHLSVRCCQSALVLRYGRRLRHRSRGSAGCVRVERDHGQDHAPSRLRSGLVQGTPVVGGGGDQAASAVGNGIVESGIVSCTLGTSGVVFGHMDEARTMIRRAASTRSATR